ncbi:MAG: hypothetical protein IJB83_00470 [Bacilli bacterium]|nr:hypothetical protein [Bacilli bacterium]
MRKLNGKNKLYLIIFTIIVIVITILLIFSIRISNKNGKIVYNISSNSVVFNSETNLLDTSSGGRITKKWNERYYYISSENNSYEIGTNPVIYELSKDEVQIFGNNYQVSQDGSIVENKNITVISDLKKPTFYKLSDRAYLIISSEIYNSDKTIYANKYLIVYIDKQGNASLLNDAINIKTINPLNLTFDKYTFDIANEKLIINETTIDLKLINGSTNEYKPKKKEENIKVDLGELVDSYNSLVNNFQQYIDNNILNIGSNQQVSNNNNNIIINGTNNNNNNDNDKQQVINKTNITKMVSLRGAISYPTYIDVTYLVSDIEDKYQAVYLLVTGYINDVLTTEKIILDKYASTYRINNLSPKNEYSISLGYVELIKGVDGTKTLTDVIEDVINVRTAKNDLSLTIEKISKGYVHFNVKMTNKYALESGKISLYADGAYSRSISIDTKKAIKTSGYSSKLLIPEGNILELRLEDAVYSGKKVDLNVRKKFVY